VCIRGSRKLEALNASVNNAMWGETFSPVQTDIKRERLCSAFGDAIVDYQRLTHANKRFGISRLRPGEQQGWHINFRDSPCKRSGHADMVIHGTTTDENSERFREMDTPSPDKRRNSYRWGRSMSKFPPPRKGHLPVREQPARSHHQTTHLSIKAYRATALNP